MRTGRFGPDDLRMWRAQERLTQAAAGRWFHLAQRTISAIEKGAWVPRDFDERMAAVLLRYYELVDAAGRPNVSRLEELRRVRIKRRRGTGEIASP